MTKYLILAAENYIVFIDNENDVNQVCKDLESEPALDHFKLTEPSG